MGQPFRIDNYCEFPTLDAAEMAALVKQFGPASDAEALNLLRTNFAAAPLSMRVAALDMMIRGRWRSHDLPTGR